MGGENGTGRGGLGKAAHKPALWQDRQTRWRRFGGTRWTWRASRTQNTSELFYFLWLFHTAGGAWSRGRAGAFASLPSRCPQSLGGRQLQPGAAHPRQNTFTCLSLSLCLAKGPSHWVLSPQNPGTLGRSAGGCTWLAARFGGWRGCPAAPGRVRERISRADLGGNTQRSSASGL